MARAKRQGLPVERNAFPDLDPAWNPKHSIPVSMSLFALLSTAVAIPLGIASVVIVFFYLRARSVERKKAALEQRRQERQAVREAVRPAYTVNATTSFSRPVTISGDSMPEFRPLSFYMMESSQASAGHTLAARAERPWLHIGRAGGAVGTSGCSHRIGDPGRGTGGDRRDVDRTRAHAPIRGMIRWSR